MLSRMYTPLVLTFSQYTSHGNGNDAPNSELTELGWHSTLPSSCVLSSLRRPRARTETSRGYIPAHITARSMATSAACLLWEASTRSADLAPSGRNPIPCRRSANCRRMSDMSSRVFPLRKFRRQYSHPSLLPPSRRARSHPSNARTRAM